MRTQSAVFALLLCCATMVAAADPPALPADGGSVAVSGNVEHPGSFSVADLRTMPIREVTDDRSTNPRNGDKDAPRESRHYTGVLLKDVLDAVKLKQREHFDLRKSIVVVTASDGYMAIFSWSELYLTPMGEGVMLVYARDGVPLPANEGPVALESLRDTQSGPRHVKWVRSVEFRTLAN